MLVIRKTVNVSTSSPFWDNTYEYGTAHLLVKNEPNQKYIDHQICRISLQLTIDCLPQNVHHVMINFMPIMMGNHFSNFLWSLLNIYIIHHLKWERCKHLSITWEWKYFDLFSKQDIKKFVLKESSREHNHL